MTHAMMDEEDSRYPLREAFFFAAMSLAGTSLLATFGKFGAQMAGLPVSTANGLSVLAYGATAFSGLAIAHFKTKTDASIVGTLSGTLLGAAAMSFIVAMPSSDDIPLKQEKTVPVSATMDRQTIITCPDGALDVSIERNAQGKTQRAIITCQP
ncbi:MAG: hypothetical protein DI551_04065 [Micavibrio aeruginosavorus]|uniref:Uncharacterized protein n=1 Tax=Micavibrio aeruginosavorus TaxID=349221 RepID=A0A2W5N0K4_9BACT|nr:MAG: hypothetical protein DI551_04065 [Micavibrio aeruginosavorus]